eukprot:scaffold71173_cov100-Phaeocystis_antarctica.AAC.1
MSECRAECRLTLVSECRGVGTCRARAQRAALLKLRPAGRRGRQGWRHTPPCPVWGCRIMTWSYKVSRKPLLRHEVEGIHRLGSLGYQVGPSEPHLTTSWTATERFRFGFVSRTVRPHRVAVLFAATASTTSGGMARARRGSLSTFWRATPWWRRCVVWLRAGEDAW